MVFSRVVQRVATSAAWSAGKSVVYLVDEMVGLKGVELAELSVVV